MARFTLEELAARAQVHDPFEVELSDGSVVTFQPPKGLPVATLLAMDARGPESQIRALLSKDDADRFLDDPAATGYSLEGIVKAYMDHFGLPTPGKSNASRTSSRDTARR